MTYGTIRELIELLPHKIFTGAAPSRRRVVKGYSTDSRSLKTGEAFIALRGERFDGHEFLAVAKDRGAVLAIVDERWFEEGKDLGLPLLVVEDTIAAYGAIASEYRDRFRIPVIAIAGSNGKTTTKELVADLLSTRWSVHRTEGNLNNLIGVPATILRLGGEHQAAVIEIGTNMPGEIARLCQILKPTHGLITNVGREHLELLGSLDGVAEEEGALFRWLAGNGGTAFVNLDDPHVARLGRRLPKRVAYGRSRSADVRGKIGKLDADGAPALTIVDGRSEKEVTIEVQLKTPGLHTAQNALAASAVALALKVTPRKVGRALEEFRPRSYAAGYARLAVVRAPDGVTVLNDTYNANPDSAVAALRTLAAMRPGRGGRRIAVMADMKELGGSSAEEHERIGRETIEIGKADVAFFHGEEMRRAYEAARKAAGASAEVVHVADRKKLAHTIAGMLDPADLILVKGSRTMHMEEIVRAILDGRPND